MPQVIINKDASDTRIRVNKVPRFPRTPVFRSRSPAEIDRALSLATVADHYFPGSSPNLALTLETPSSRVGACEDDGNVAVSTRSSHESPRFFALFLSLRDMRGREGNKADGSGI